MIDSIALQELFQIPLSSRFPIKSGFYTGQSFPSTKSLCFLFQSLNYCPTEMIMLGPHHILQRFLVFVISKKTSVNLDELLFILIDKRSSSNLNCLPPSSNALVMNIFRCVYQSGWVLGNTITQHNQIFPTSWGWISHEGHLQQKWTSLSVQENLQKAIICQCRIDKCQTCKCGKNNIRRLVFCNCSRKCQNS